MMPLCLNDLRVLQVVPALDTGGVERTTIEIAEGIVDSGGTALVATAGGRLEDKLRQVGGKIIRMDLNKKDPISIFKNSKRLKQVIRDFEVEIVHARSRAPAWSAHWAARSLGVPFVTTYHGVYNEIGPLKKIYNSIMASGDIVIANSHFTANAIRKRYNIPEARLRVIERGVDIDVFNRRRISKERIMAFGGGLARLGKPGDAIFLLPARLTRWKGQEVAIDAASLLLSSGFENFILVIAGDHQGRTKYRTKLISKIESLGLERHVILSGNVDDIAAAYAMADFTVIPSIEPEAFGRTAAESQSLGVPVIASAIGALLDTVLDGRTGWLVEAGNASSIANAMCEAMSLPPQKYTEMSRAAETHALQRFCSTKMVSATLECYATLLS